MIFRKPGWKQPLTKIKINGCRIIPTSFVKYLGIYLDEFLNGSAHCEQLSTKLGRANGMLAKTRYHLKNCPEHIKTLYFSIFSSHMTYGCQTWGQTYNKHFKRIEVLQNNAIRIINFSPSKRDGVTPFYKMSKILKLRDHITMLNILFVHDFINNKLPICFQSFFKLRKDLHSHDTKFAKSGKLYEPRVNSKNYGSDSIKLKCIKQWNDFLDLYPETDFTIINRKALQKKVTNHFLNLD